MVTKDKDNLPAPVDLTGDRLSTDLSRVEVSNPLLGKVRLSSSARSVGPAIAWLVLVGSAIAAGYATDRLAASASLSPTLTICLTLIVAVAVLGAGILFVVNNQVSQVSQVKKGKKDKKG